MTARLDSVNVGRRAPNTYKEGVDTGIDKVTQDATVEVRDPGPEAGGSGVVGDFIGDLAHHGGSDQALYAFQREDLDAWSQRLDRPLRNGFFGENLTTVGIDLAAARIGERWRVGSSVEVVVTAPRIPCSTFRGWIDEQGWLTTFTRDARPGTYLRIAVPGRLGAGDQIKVLHRPAHDVTVALMFRAEMDRPDLLPMLLEAGDDLHPDIAADARATAAHRPSDIVRKIS
jgi:MOSC domain-containing protein YiiM